MSDVRCTTWGCGQRLHLTDFGTGLATKEIRFPDDYKSAAAGKWLPYCDCARRSTSRVTR